MVTYPPDWKDVQLKDIGYIQMCRRIFQDQTKNNGQIPFYKIGTFGGKADAYIPRDLFQDYKNLYPYPVKGDVLLSAAGTVGKAIIFDGRESYFQDSNIVWLKVDENEIDRKFLYYFYKSFPWKALEGTTIGRLYNNIILDTDIHLPPLPEQQAIASALSDFDEHIDNLTKLIEKKKAIRDGALEDLVSGRTRLDGFNGEWINVKLSDFAQINPSDWKEIKIGDTGRVITGSTPSTSNKHYWGKEYTWITPTDIDDRVFMYSSERKLSKQGFEISRQLPPGSVLITCIASIGKNCILAGVG